MRELVYPERQRCRACRRYFGFEVILGRFCCLECAGLVRLEEIPRECRNSPGRGGGLKRAFLDQQEADAYNTDPEQHSYQCGYCRNWHLGHEPSDLFLVTS